MTPLLLMAVMLAGGETVDAPADEPGVVIVATTPTNVQLRADAQDVVIPLRPVRPATSRSATRTGMWIGASIAIVAAALPALAGNHEQRPQPPQGECDPFCGGGAGALG